MATSPYAAPLGSPKFRAFDTSGDPLAAGKVYVYEAGTTTPTDSYPTYADALAGTNANANPVVLDANGEAAIFLQNALYKIVLKTSADVTQWTMDSVSTALGLDYTATGDISSKSFFTAIKSGNQTAIGAATKVITWTMEEDANSEWDNANNRWVCADAGRYMVQASVEHSDANANVAFTLSIYKNGSQVGRATTRNHATPATVTAATAHYLDTLAASDYIEIYAASTTGTVYGTSGTRFSVVRL